jgi:hypothetical protein
MRGYSRRSSGGGFGGELDVRNVVHGSRLDSFKLYLSQIDGLVGRTYTNNSDHPKNAICSAFPIYSLGGLISLSRQVRFVLIQRIFHSSHVTGYQAILSTSKYKSPDIQVIFLSSPVDYKL